MRPLRLLVGGSPCTYWSISQNPYKREKTCTGMGWELYKNFLIAKDKFKPDYFLYENNESISMEIQKEIGKTLGFDLLHINSSRFSAQTRKRIYCTNLKIGELPKDREKKVLDILDDNHGQKNLISEVVFKKEENFKYNIKPIRVGIIGKGGQGERVYSAYGKSCTLSANGGGRGAKTGLYLIGDVVRKLSPLEAERLQTLPDNYTLCKGVSDTQRYKCIGNGWTADVIIWILSHMDIDKSTPLEILSLYDGIATARYVLDKLGFNNIIYKAYEIDKYAINVALNNYNDIIHIGDAFNIRNESWHY